MNDKSMMKAGLLGSLVAAVCCFTPLLVVMLAGVGLSAITGWLDYVLFPILFASLGLVAQALYVQAGRIGISPKPVITILIIVLSVALFWLDFRYALRLSIGAVLAVVLYAFWLRRRASRAS